MVCLPDYNFVSGRRIYFEEGFDFNVFSFFV